MKPDLTIEMLIERTEQDPNSGCWLWARATSSTGYGFIAYNGGQTTAHRAMLGLTLGRKLGRHEFACHRCDTPACIRPDHLFVGSNQDNTADSVAKGRRFHCRGETNPRAKISEATALEIKRSPLPARAVAAGVGVSLWSVYAIRSGRVWPHLHTAQRLSDPTPSTPPTSGGDR